LSPLIGPSVLLGLDFYSEGEPSCWGVEGQLSHPIRARCRRFRSSCGRSHETAGRVK